jgi:hypothetical protein
MNNIQYSTTENTNTCVALPINPQQQILPQQMPPIQNSPNSQMDYLDNLPTESITPSKLEQELSDKVFGKQLSLPKKFIKESKDMLILGLLFILFSLPQVDSLIKKFIPITNNLVYILIFVKAVFLMILYWILKHFYLSRK